MKTSTKIIYPVLALFSVACFALSPAARAVVTPADGDDSEAENEIASGSSEAGAQKKTKKKKGKKPTVTLSAAPTNINEGQTAAYTIHASKVNPTQPITVNYSMTGNAILGTHYTLDGNFGHAVIPAGSSSTAVPLNALVTNLTMGSETSIMTLTSGNGYQLKKAKKGKKGKKGKKPPQAAITIDNIPSP